MLGSSAPVILGMLPRATFDEIYAGGPDVVLAGAFNPTGVASPVDGGFRATGRWAFASGCQHADWFVAHCFVDDGRMPPLRMMVVPASEVEIVDTWTVSGLCGTGSHDFTIDGVFVPDEYTFSVFEEGGLDGPLGRIPELSYSSLEFANVAIGIAEGALDRDHDAGHRQGPHVRRRDAGGEPTVPTPARRGRRPSPCRGCTARQHASHRHGGPRRPERGVHAPRSGRIRATATWATSAAAAVADTAYTAGGGTALYSSSPLQRRLRDAHTHHAALRGQTRHVHARRGGARRPGCRHHLPVVGRDGRAAAPAVETSATPARKVERLAGEIPSSWR